MIGHRKPDHEDALALMRRASEFDARGAHAGAADAWAQAIAADPTLLPARLGLAQAQIRAGRPADALSALAALRETAPAMPAVWLATAVAQSMLGKHGDAIASAERGVSLAPSMAPLHLGLGDVLRQAGRLSHASAAYRRAVELDPANADALNKLATAERTMGRHDRAEALLRDALVLAPRHPYARVNLGTLEAVRGNLDAGRARLAAALDDALLPADAREEARDAVAMIDERRLLDGPIDEAVAGGDPRPIALALRSLDRGAAVDEVLLADLSRIVERLESAPRIDDRFPEGAPASFAWPALEAHHNLKRPRDDAALAHSVALVAGERPVADDDDRDLVHYARIVARASSPDHDDPVAFEAWLRLRHAQLATHRPRLDPGQFSIVNNIVRGARHVPRTPPARIPATLRRVLDELLPRVPGGAWRAVFLYLTVGELHPFTDGNGRTMRLMVNRLLAGAGRYPHLHPPGNDGSIQSAARATADLEPLVDWLSAGSRYAAELDRAWAARDPR